MRRILVSLGHSVELRFNDLQLSTVRQHYTQGFSSVLGLVEQLEMEIESLTLSCYSKHHDRCLRQTINIQKSEIERLNGKIEQKSQQLLDSQRSNHQLRKASQFHQKEKDNLNRRWQHKINKLENRLTSVQQINQELQKRIQELEKCLESDAAPPVKLDSHNSSLPPALDPPWSKPKRTRSLRRKSGNQVGGVSGHRGSTLRQTSEPDQVIVHRVVVCQHCHHSLIPTESQRVHKRQLFEIENGKLTVIEHQAEIKLCPFCRQISNGFFPVDLKAPVQYGKSVFSRILYLNQYQLLPVGRTAESMNDLFACPVSWATVNRAARICSDKLLRVELKIKAGLRNSSVLGVDETGVRINGKIAWVHLARTETLTHLAVHPKRGSAAFDEIGIINRFEGVLVRDGWQPYERYEQCRHSLCNAHLLRNLTFVGENEPLHQAWTNALLKLLVRIKEAVDQAKANSETVLNQSRQSSFSARYDKILAGAARVIRGSPKRKDVLMSAHNLYQRFLTNKPAILRFMTDIRVPFDNNGSERDLRMLKLQQKISGCFRSVEGVKVFCRIRSYLSSSRKQGRGLLTALEHTLKGKPITLTS